MLVQQLQCKHRRTRVLRQFATEWQGVNWPPHDIVRFTPFMETTCYRTAVNVIYGSPPLRGTGG